MSIASELYTTFANRLQWWSKQGARCSAFASQIPFLAPAYFFDDIVHERGAVPSSVPVRDLEMPSEEFWLVYRTLNGPLGYIDNIVLVRRDGDIGKIFPVYHLNGNIVSDTEFLFGGNDFGEKAIKSAHPATVLPLLETMPEVLACIATLIAPVTEIETDTGPSKAKSVVKRAGNWRRDPLFIVIRKTKTVSVARGGTHASPRGHVRSEHWRAYKSGKRVLVREHAVKGGSAVARNYRVVP